MGQHEVYTYICKHKGTTIQKISKDLNNSINSVNRHVTKLEKYGFVKTKYLGKKKICEEKQKNGTKKR